MLFVALGDATDIRTRGGTPYFLSLAGMRAGFIKRAAALPLGTQQRRRALWNVRRLLLRGERGGYQFTAECAERLFRAAQLSEPAGEVLSQFPMFPPDSWLSRSDVSYYLDATLKQNFEAYGLAAKVGPRMRAEVLAREKDRYHSARRVVCMSRWAADSVVTDYGVPPSKVFVIPGAANIGDDDASVAHEASEPPLSPLRLGFIGKQVERKNLSLLLRVAESLDERGIPVEVLAAGFAPESVPAHRLFRPVGFIDKRTQMRDFVSFVRRCHFGCLFSHAEAFGLSNVEFIRLGVPVLTWDVGGLSDTVPPGLGHVFPGGCSAVDIADKVLGYARDQARYRALRTAVTQRRDEVTFDRAIARFQRVWRGETHDCLTTLRAL